MGRVSVWMVSAVVSISCVLGSSRVSAQQAASISGVVRDTSGAVLPGVTVEAASPALIEKVRNIVSDGDGQYRIVDLRPGTYTVTFSLTGFSTYKREGVELTAGFNAAINGEMKVGSLEETITVTGASPLVDTQNVRQQIAVTEQTLEALPTGTTGVSNLAAFTPGLTTTAGSNVGGSAGTYNSSSVISSTFHGKTGAITQYDGMSVNNPVRPGATGYIISPATLQEWVVETGGGLAESNAGTSVALNVVPKEGGNTFRGQGNVVFSNGAMQGSNLTDALRARNLTTVGQIDYLYDADFSLGGPIKADKLWFFTSHRVQGNENQRAGVFFNATQNTVFFTPDQSRPAFREDLLNSNALRLTWQINQKNKLNAHVEPQRNCVCRGRGEFVAPEAAYRWNFWPTGLYQVTWNATVSNRLLFEAAGGVMHFQWPVEFQPETGNAISVLDQATNFTYGSAGGAAALPLNVPGPRRAPRYSQRGSMTYVTGSHNFKTGFHLMQGVTEVEAFVNQNRSYRFRGSTPTTAVPNLVTLYANPFFQKEEMNANLGMFVQDRWTLNRLSLNLGLRFEYVNSEIVDHDLPAGEFVGARRVAAIKNVPNWTDLNPRMGAAYDLFGNGRTAIRASFGRYVIDTSTEIAQSINPIFANSTVNRTWGDSTFGAGDPRTGNFVPDCDLRNPLTNGECGAWDNQNFGTPAVRARYSSDVVTGFGNRGYLWDLATEVQQELGSKLSVRVGYYRNWDGNLTVTDNLEVRPSDFSPYCVTAPTDPRLPNGGGYEICGLYNESRAVFGRSNTVVEKASKFGEQKRVSDFIAINLTSRFGNGIQLGGGLDTGRTVSDRCYVVDNPGHLTFDYTTPTAPTYCRIDTPFSAQTQIKLFGAYPLPYAFMVSGVLQNLSGPQIRAVWAAPNSAIAPSLGRNLSACPSDTGPCAATLNIPLVRPQTVFEDRRTQLDVRVSRRFKLGSRYSFDASLDVYNVTNSGSVITLSETFGPTWQQPTAILDARMLQLNGRFTF